MPQSTIPAAGDASAGWALLAPCAGRRPAAEAQAPRVERSVRKMGTFTYFRLEKVNVPIFRTERRPPW
jgi:hypothetical protein